MNIAIKNATGVIFGNGIRIDVYRATCPGSTYPATITAANIVQTQIVTAFNGGFCITIVWTGGPLTGTDLIAIRASPFLGAALLFNATVVIS